MVHCGYEATAVKDTVRRPWKAPGWRCCGVRTEGPMAPEISLENQRPAEYVFSSNVAEKLDEIRKTTPNPKKVVDSGLRRGKLVRASLARRGSDASCAGLRAEVASTARALSVPSGLRAFATMAGRLRSAGSQMIAERCEDKAMPRRELAGDMRFHVDRGRAGVAPGGRLCPSAVSSG